MYLTGGILKANLFPNAKSHNILGVSKNNEGELY